MTLGLESTPLDFSGLERAMAFLRERVKASGLKGSLVRDAVARAALERPGHFTAEDLVRDLRARGCQYAHTSTVYRTLPLLVRLGLLRTTLVTLGEHTHYERSFERENHDHLVCMQCHMIVEFASSEVNLAQRDAAASHGFSVVGRVLEVYGICSTCRTKSRVNDLSVAPRVTATWETCGAE
jgi:Fur family ferric uptake transcriptional regulator